MDEYELSTCYRHFSNLNLPATLKDYNPLKKTLCPATSGLDNVHTEILALLITDNIFRDFFNVFLLLPIHAHQCVVRKSNEDTFFKVFPHERGSGMRLSNDRMLKWLYSNRLPFFLSSRLYELCIFTYKFCKDNRYLVFDENVEYTKKQLNMFSDLTTVEGIQKVIRHAGNTSDGAAIQLWLDLQCLHHTDKDQGYNDMMRSILARYQLETNKLRPYLKKALTKAVNTVGKVSFKSFHLKRKDTLWKNFDILVHAPFLDSYSHSDVNKASQDNVTGSNVLNDLQDEIMETIKNDFCKRYLCYYDCLPAKFREVSPDMTINSVMDNHGTLDAGRSKSTLPTVTVNKIPFQVNSNRPKTCYPHLHPKIRAISRLSAKTSGYISLTPDDRLAVCSSKASTLLSEIHKCGSEPNLHYHEPIAIKKGEICRYNSMVNINANTNIEVNEIALEKCRKSVMEDLDTQLSDHSTVSIDLESNNDQVNKPSVSSSPMQATISHTQTISPELSISPKKNSRLNLRHLVPFSRENRDSDQLKDVDLLDSKEEDKPQSSSEKLETMMSDGSFSVILKRREIFDNVMRVRRASSFIRKSPGLKELYGNANEEQKKAQTLILKNKSPDVMYNQDKIRLYTTFVASDRLAGGPFRNYLTTNHNDDMLDSLSLWENIEVLRCFTTEGGRRGATAKSFGGNGFLSSHDEFNTIKDDPYHQYHNSLREIKKYPDSLYDFKKKLQLIKEFISENPIKKPYEIEKLNIYVEQLETAGCSDEVLALTQDHMVTKLRSEIDTYYNFDSKNFYYYVSQHDKKFQFPNIIYKTDEEEDKAHRFLLKSRRKYINPQYHTTQDLFRECIFSPMSSRLWISIDMCERLTFPFASRKLSMPMLTLGSMIHMKVFLMRRRKKKELLGFPVITDEEKPEITKKPQKKKMLMPKLYRKEMPSFFINWDAVMLEHKSKVYDIIENLRETITKEPKSLAPPSIDYLFIEDPTLKSFRKYIAGNYRNNEKDLYLSIINFIIALKQVEEKINWCDIGDLSKSVCSSFVFGKNSILNNLNLPSDKMELITKKRAYEPTFVLFVGSLVKKWIGENLWSSFLRGTYKTKNIDFEQYLAVKECQSRSIPSVYNKIFCKRLMHFITKLKNFQDFLSVPEQYEEFRQFLINLRQTNKDCGNQVVDKVLFSKNAQHKLYIILSRLPQDLKLLYEIYCYKNLVLTSLNNARDMSYDGTEEPLVKDKINIIIDTFLDSTILPRLQVNLPGPCAADIIISVRKQHIPYNLFNEATAYLLQPLLIYWRKFCLFTYAPPSTKKNKILKTLSGTPLSVPSPPLHLHRMKQMKVNEDHLRSSGMSLSKSRISLSKVEVGGFQFSITNGVKDLYRAKCIVNPIHNVVSGSGSSNSLRSNLSKVSRLSSICTTHRATLKNTELKKNRWAQLKAGVKKEYRAPGATLPPLIEVKLSDPVETDVCG